MELWSYEVIKIRKSSKINLEKLDIFISKFDFLILKLKFNQ